MTRLSEGMSYKKYMDVRYPLPSSSVFLRLPRD
jgi:hypothetical protein